MGSAIEIDICPRTGWQWLNLGELWDYHELLGFLVWRDIKVRYKQTLLGGIWAVLQPLVGMLVLGVLSSRITHIETGSVPYPLFVFAGLVPWTFFSNAVSFASVSLVGSEQMIRKTYFPRIFIPLASIVALGLDMLLGLFFTGLLILYYHRPINAAIILLPLFGVGTLMTTCGLGFIFAALNVRYRDVKYALPFFIQIGFFLTPVIYPSRYVPARYTILMGLNPMAGMLDGFRHALLGGPASWPLIFTSAVVATILFIFGLIYFHSMERSFADVI